MPEISRFYGIVMSMSKGSSLLLTLRASGRMEKEKPEGGEKGDAGERLTFVGAEFGLR